MCSSCHKSDPKILYLLLLQLALTCSEEYLELPHSVCEWHPQIQQAAVVGLHKAFLQCGQTLDNYIYGK